MCVCLSVIKRDILLSFPYSDSKLTQPLPQYAVHRTLNLVYFPPWSTWFINGSIVSLSYQIYLEFAEITLVLFVHRSLVRSFICSIVLLFICSIVRSQFVFPASVTAPLLSTIITYIFYADIVLGMCHLRFIIAMTHTKTKTCSRSFFIPSKVALGGFVVTFVKPKKKMIMMMMMM